MSSMRRRAAWVFGAAALQWGVASPAEATERPGAKLSGWDRVTPGAAQVFGIQVRPACSGLPVEGVDTHGFSFWAKRGDPERLVIFFQGGGACWDAGTCLGRLPDGTTAERTFRPYIDPAFDPGAPGRLSGIFDAANAANPVRDWSFLYIPYCTGDVHAGSRERVIKAGDMRFTLRHRGFDNALAALDYARQHFAPREVLVAGSSAGGYGAVLNLPWVKRAFPDARMAVLSDGAQGVTPPAWDAVRDEAWNFQLAPWLFAGLPKPVSTGTIMSRTLAAYPDVRFAQYTTAWDLVQVSFYDLMIGAPGVPANGTLCVDWERRMRRGVLTLQRAVNYRSYLGSGTTHTALSSERFFTEPSAGPSLAAWLGAMLRHREGDEEGSGDAAGSADANPRPWRSVTCAGACEMPEECPY